MSYTDEGGQQPAGVADPAEASGEAASDVRGGPEAHAVEHELRREEDKAPDPVVRRGAEEDAVFGGETRREAAVGGGQAAARTGVLDDDEGRKHVVVLTPEGGKCISVRVCEGEEHTVVRRKAARLFRSERVILTRPFEVKGPSGIPVPRKLLFRLHSRE